MIGKIFITRQGYDPELGKHVKDPYLGELPSLGACRPDLRRQLNPGDEIFAISGKVKGASQFVMGGFEVASKMNVRDAFDLFPEQRLSMREDGQIGGNIIIDGNGKQHPLDTMQAHLAGYTVAILDPEPTSARLIRFRTSVMGSVRSCWSSSGLMCGSRLRSRAPRRIPVATRLAAARTAAGSSQ